MAVESIVEEVATNLEEAAVATRAINARVIGSFLGGTGVGVILGFALGYKLSKDKARARAREEADEEIEEVREIYRRKTLALDNIKEKAKEEGKVEGVIEAEHYRPPRTEEDILLRGARPLPAPVPVQPAEPFRPTVSTDSMVDPDWVYSEELAKRDSRFPYVIHEDEFMNESPPTHTTVEYTFYSLDEVLVDEHNERIMNVAALVGAESLERFGHGSSDPNVVYVRNDRLQLQIEITRLDKSYEVDVVGLSDDS